MTEFFIGCLAIAAIGLAVGWLVYALRVEGSVSGMREERDAARTTANEARATLARLTEKTVRLEVVIAKLKDEIKRLEGNYDALSDDDLRSSLQRLLGPVPPLPKPPT